MGLEPGGYGKREVNSGLEGRGDQGVQREWKQGEEGFGTREGMGGGRLILG